MQRHYRPSSATAAGNERWLRIQRPNNRRLTKLLRGAAVRCIGLLGRQSISKEKSRRSESVHDLPTNMCRA